jgi:2-polyprenyl-6-hydroxyphenyl methylase/3-demethylubiquinone-9 3-methyltransferase
MERLEHVPDPSSTVAACARLAKPGGQVFFSDHIYRNHKSYPVRVVGAEVSAESLPKRGRNDYARLHQTVGAVALVPGRGLEPLELKGMTYNPLTNHYRLGDDCDVNYSLCCCKVAAVLFDFDGTLRIPRRTCRARSIACAARAAGRPAAGKLRPHAFAARAG